MTPFFLYCFPPYIAGQQQKAFDDLLGERYEPHNTTIIASFLHFYMEAV